VWCGTSEALTYTPPMEILFPPDVEARLADWSRRTGRATSEFIEEAIRERFDAETQQAVAEGFAGLDRGEFVTHEDVRAQLDGLVRR
jgi:predicted transcriptional regulator